MASLLQSWHRYRRASGLRAEGLALLACLLLGLTLVPLLIWVVGTRTLGPYTNGSPLALWRDDLSALAHGSLPHWVVALGPYAALWCWRALRTVLAR
jgi:hypothetical protein